MGGRLLAATVLWAWVAFGCASSGPPWRWNPPQGATAERQNRDRAECRLYAAWAAEEISVGTGPSDEYFEARDEALRRCLEQRGWSWRYRREKP